MAELATGAVNMLLGVIRNEARRLGRVQGDVMFIQEEMESMRSFLAHLARTHREDHDEQVRAWMNQVRVLASDCNNCIDTYLYRRNPDFHRPRRGLRRYLWWGWTLWWLREVVARHQAAGQLRELKDRACNIGERRLRYGVKVSDGTPGHGAADLTAAPSHSAAPEDEEEEDGHELEDGRKLTSTMDDSSDVTTTMVKDFLKNRLLGWIESLKISETPLEPKPIIPYIAFALSNTEIDKDVMVREALAEAQHHLSWSILVDIPDMHLEDHLHVPLRPKEILFYILWTLQDQDSQGQRLAWLRKWEVYYDKKNFLYQIKKHMVGFGKKMEEIYERIGYQLPQNMAIMKDKKELQYKIDNEELDLDLAYLWLLIVLTVAVAEREDQEWKKTVVRTLSRRYNDIINRAAIELKELVRESTDFEQQVQLDTDEYERILEEVFPRTPVQELRGYDKSSFREATRKKIGEITLKIREQLKIKKIVYEIQSNLQHRRILIILKTHHKYGWEVTRNTLSLLGASGCFAGAAIFMTTYPQLELVELSAVGYYTEIVRQHAGKHMHQDNLKIVRDILEKCERHQFGMNIFAQAMIANPKRSTKELHKLHSILQAMPKRLPSSIAKKMLKFSYDDLPKQQKSCLLYLAIFPPDSECKIKRTSLVGRWVAEGLIATEDWSWFNSVTEAEKCFDVLINRQFVRPADIGAAGRVKSCMVYPQVHRFITKIAKKQHIVEARLSLHLAHHFSIFNDIRLRESDTIETFLKKNMQDPPQFSKLKVLDLEGCRCINNGHLKDICSKISMLKYLSLRHTGVDQLPRQINKLHKLEVLDIRQTKIRASATRHVLLLKLKRLLAGQITDACPCSTDTILAEDFCSVEIPDLIEKLTDMEVLSHVKPRRHRDLGDIGNLCQLRKLGVVINKDSHIQSLLDAISDLHDCLRSLSITLNIPRCESTRPGKDLSLKKHPKSLESLSIRGSTQKGQLLPLLATKDSKLTKVTLSYVSLNQDDLKVLAKLQNLVCVRLGHDAYAHGEQLTFDNNEFLRLKVLIVDHSGISKINFNGECPELEKIIWSFNEDFCARDMEPLSGIDKLQGLKELELIGDIIAPRVDEAFQKYSNEQKFVYKHKRRENQEQA